MDKIFAKVEKNKEKLFITDWAITNTTLEEVFLRISKDRHGEEEPMKKSRMKRMKRMKYFFSDAHYGGISESELV